MARLSGVTIRMLALVTLLIGGIATSARPAGSAGLPHRELVVNGRPTACASVASTDAEQEQGLRGAPLSAPPMAFVFGRPGRYGFWMAGVSEPITVGWVAAQRLISAVAMAPESDNVYGPPVPIRLAVEFIAGRGLPAIGSKLSLGRACRP